MDRTKCDGLRLDAVKHVPYDFFGASSGSDKDFSDYGYAECPLNIPLALP